MTEMTPEERQERIEYFTILYKRSIVALNVYKEMEVEVDKTVIEAQEQKVRTYKRQLENILKEEE